MKKMFARDAPDVLEVTRRLLLGITPDDCDFLSDKDDAKRASLLKEAYDITQTEVFRLIIKSLLAKQAEYTAWHSENWDALLLARGSLNGISLVEEYCDDLRAKYEELTRPKKVLNKYDII